MEKQIQDYDDASSHGDENTSFLNNSVKDTVRRNSIKYLLLANLFFFVMSALTLVCAIYMQHSKASYTTAGLLDEFGLFSPVAGLVEYQRSQFKPAHPTNSSTYVGIDAAVDNAWDDITALPDHIISAENFPKLDRPATSVKVSDPKTGEMGYRAGLRVFRQLQCLNLLRMASHSNYAMKLPHNEAVTVRENLDQCVEMLRMDLMCLSDVSVFTYNDNGQGIAADYESNRVCRNFDTIKQWTKDNAISSASR
ncbi:hypothetical protein DM02DRAFT_524101 [Periconia macrospinosa]|uniref:Tat pathway signal sequence n=1 Tax=Periconia macrospinosa TaxID=97972 RepID=A0A2V1DUQ9_9PLEO|nr:hypothetical protein DM02DRAFT_524101 [Periconia macrospinosa]